MRMSGLGRAKWPPGCAARRSAHPSRCRSACSRDRGVCGRSVSRGCSHSVADASDRADERLHGRDGGSLRQCERRSDRDPALRSRFALGSRHNPVAEIQQRCVPDFIELADRTAQPDRAWPATDLATATTARLAQHGGAVRPATRSLPCGPHHCFHWAGAPVVSKRRRDAAPRIQRSRASRSSVRACSSPKRAPNAALRTSSGSSTSCLSNRCLRTWALGVASTAPTVPAGSARHAEQGPDGGQCFSRLGSDL